MDRSNSNDRAPGLPGAHHNGETGPRVQEAAPRYLLYSHDSFGLGHLRRNLTLAKALVTSRPGASVLIVTGSPCATFFECPQGVELVKLPSVSKDEQGRYCSRSLPGPIDFTLELRRRILLETYRAYQPHVLIVDHQVVGLMAEALPLLRAAKEDGVRTILGVRDVIDSPAVVAKEWGTEDARWALSIGYDRICVYGSPEVFDTRSEYRIPPELGANLEFVGYVVRKFPRHSRRPVPSLRPRVLVTVGGGEDGGNGLERVIDALALRAGDHDTVIVSGPLLAPREARRLKRRVRNLQGVEIHRFHNDLPRLMAESDLVVCMAGYNTCAELLYSGRRAVFLPRTFPRREQVIRAERLAALGLGTCLEDPKAEVLSAAITKELAHNRREGGLRTWVAPMTGAANLTAIAEELVDGVAAQAKTPTQRVNELDRKAQRLAAFLGAIE
ncbi:MAG: putative glycosyltransferase [Planctomycetota bacterium]|jgi:predicted glycosyltransferase